MRKMLVATLAVLCIASQAWANDLIDFNRIQYAAENGDWQAALQVGKAFYNGQFRSHAISRDYNQAYKYLRKGNAGEPTGNHDPEAEYMIGMCFLNGTGVAYSVDNAKYWLQSAANSGYGPARQALNQLPSGYDGGLSPVVSTLGPVEPPRHHDPRLDRLMQAAESGYADAQYQLGMAYLRGEHGLPQDPRQAYHWLHEAAMQGNRDARREMTRMHHYGIGSESEGQYWNDASGY